MLTKSTCGGHLFNFSLCLKSNTIQFPSNLRINTKIVIISMKKISGVARKISSVIYEITD
jgi:hypothetical protein